MVLWESWLQDVASSWNVTTSEVGIIVSLCFTIGTLVVVLIATRGKSAIVTIPVSSFLCIVIFIFLEWFPTWIGSIIALVLSIFMGFMFMNIGGK